MAPPNFQPLLALLDREEKLQKLIAEILDRATKAASGRQLDHLQSALAELDEATRKEQAFSSERDYLLTTITPRESAARASKTLREVAALPGAPASQLLKIRDQLAAGAGAVREKLKRLQPLVRELGEVYRVAVTAIVHNKSDEAASARDYQHGSLLNLEA